MRDGGWGDARQSERPRHPALFIHDPPFGLCHICVSRRRSDGAAQDSRGVRNRRWQSPKGYLYRSIPMTDLICVGAVSGSFGVKGEVRLKSFTANPEAIADYGPLHFEDGSQSLNLRITRQIKNGFAARLSGVSTKEQADALRGTRLYAPRDRLPSLPDDEFYHTDLIGLSVFDTGGTLLGSVKAVLNHGASDLLELSLTTGGTELIPFTVACIPTVDLSAGRIIADPPEGLLE